ncbi:hypothetical protein ABZ896_27685 [Streptomyces sp. NPDC047072]|uniref:hypothetical protein n=1 Tax=Streptomyces sp. NPDC047072 TaxID=3154809 RepID=UPI00340AA182
MGNHADDEGTDVEIYIRLLTATDAPERLLALLDSLGFERRTLTTAGPVYVWHEVPNHLTEAEKKKLATGAVPSLLVAGYLVHITDAVWDAAAYQDAAEAVRRQHAAAAPGTSAASTVRARQFGDTASTVSHDRKESPLVSLADEYAVDVEFYHRDGTLYVDTRTSAPEQLRALLDRLGLNRHGREGEIWHRVPDQMDEIAMKEIADRAAWLLPRHGYQVSIITGLFGGTAYRLALAASPAHQPSPAPATPAPRAPRSRRTH